MAKRKNTPDAAAPAAPASEHPPGASGSIDVALSNPHLPVASDGTPVATVDPGSGPGSAPVASGHVRVAVAGDHTDRTRRLTEAAKDTLGAGLGVGMEALGTGIDRIGEGVSRIGEATRKVPLVGSSVSKVGEGLSQVGGSIHDLPRVAGTRRGRLLVRSLVVGLLLVASWIAVIVALQLKGNDTPDFRPIAARVLTELSAGPESIERVYERASPRFQEWVRKDRFLDEMNDLRATLGPFTEISAVNDTLVSASPTGRVGRVSLTVAYAKGTCKASVSLHADQGAWKLLGISVELPPALEITQAQRELRVQACKDPMARACDLHVAATAILEQLRDGRADRVWQDATSVFQKQEEQARFAQIHGEYARTLGPYVRLLRVTEAKLMGSYASFDAIAEFARSAGVRVIFGFYRPENASPWKLRSLKITLPMPRADELPTEPPPPPPTEPEIEAPVGAGSDA